MKKILIILGLVSISILLVILTSRDEQKISTVAGHSFRLHIADSQIQRELGLSVFERLSPDEGMVFLGMTPGQQSFWMKDMKFDIDILWIASDDKVIYIEHSVSKDSYPRIYSNQEGTTSDYVIELPAGSAQRLDIKVGDSVRI